MKTIASPQLFRKENKLVWLGSMLIPFILFWLILFLQVPDSLTHYFHAYSSALFLIVLFLYYLSFNLEDHYAIATGLGLTMILLALSLAYLWSSGFSDNLLISGLLPYKDAKNYFLGANLLLHGFPLVEAGQATERPLFPGFLSTILFLTGRDLKITLAIMAQLAAIGIYFSARQMNRSFGAVAASFYIVLLEFYIQPFVGYSLSEMLGFTAGCFGFAMICLAAYRTKWIDLLAGIFLLLIAVSARAGAFFLFPLLALWIGWIFRGERIFSLKMFVYALLTILAGYVLVNSVYARLLGIPPGFTFGNFSYAIYGQVRGGTGWHSAIEDLGTRNPAIVYRAAWEFFLKHPVSLLIGFAKSYRDFFITGDGSIFFFGKLSWRNGLNSFLWILTLALLGLGLFRSIKNIRSNLAALIVAGFIGVFLSIPFLPPIDGGSRFHASTAPFFFALPAIGTASFLNTVRRSPSVSDDPVPDLKVARYFSVGMTILVILFPLLIYSFSRGPAFSTTACPVGQEPFYIESPQGTYVDLVKNESASCGFMPQICQDDFDRNNAEKGNDDFYEFLTTSMQEQKSGIRLIPALDFVSNEFHYFSIPLARFDENSSAAKKLSGCAVEVLTKNQTIYQVESLLPEK